MSAVVEWHCDEKDCDLWVLVGELSEDWIVVYPGTGEPKHFCDGWHAMLWFSTWAEPSVEVPTDLEGPDV